MRSQLSQNGEYAVYQNSMTPLGYYDQANRTAGTAFVIGAGAAGEIGYSYHDFWAADDCFCFECPSSVNSRYLYYVLQNNQDSILSKVRRSSVPRLSRSVLENMMIPIPPIDYQNRVVSILDKFYALSNDIASGIPAEIEARTKQYEYYRDILLKFDRVA